VINQHGHFAQRL
jgi:hypothetical protein